MLGVSSGPQGSTFPQAMNDGAGRIENTELFRGKGMLVPGMDLKMKGVPTAGQLRMWEVFKIIFWGSSQLRTDCAGKAEERGRVS